MRCSICDYCEGDAGSLYHGSLVEPKGSRRRKVYLDNVTGEPICTVCKGFSSFKTGMKGRNTNDE